MKSALLGGLHLDALVPSTLELKVASDVGGDEGMVNCRNERSQLASLRHFERTLTIVRISAGVLASNETRLVQDAELVDLGLLVELRVVVPVAVKDVDLVPGQVATVDRDAVVVLGVASADARPVTLLLAKVEAGGVGEESPGHEGAGESEPRHLEGLEVRMWSLEFEAKRLTTQNLVWLPM